MPDAAYSALLAAAIAEARAKLPMDALFARLGLGEHCDKQANKRKACPYCERHGTFSPHFLADKRVWTYNCWGSDCRANKLNRPAKTGDEIGLISLVEGKSRRDAMWRYLELAGVDRPKGGEKKTERHQEEEPAPEPEAEPSPEDVAAAHGPETATGPAAGPEESKIVDFPPPPAPPEPPKAKTTSSFGGGDESAAIWQAFHALLQLRSEDRAALREERGFSDALIDELGFRSNCLTNEAALQVLRERFPMRQLLRTGLWKRDPAGRPIIERQFTGWGILKKEKGPDGKPREDWGQAERPLIPYYDRFKRLTFMRPHKGNIANPDKDDEEVCGGHVYCPYLLTRGLESTEGLLVLTESEYKASALFACCIPALGIPGTGFVRNAAFRKELVKLLNDFRVREVVIIFDNEEHGVIGLPGFRNDPWKRHSTKVWSKYIAWDLMKRTPTPPSLERVRIGWLPDAWRVDDAGKPTGKIDWDTALAGFVRRSQSILSGTNAATAAFWGVINDAVLPEDFLRQFSSEARQISGKQLEDLWHQPLLKHGGPREERLAARFDGLNGKTPQELVFCARSMSAELRRCVGTYFERKSPTDKRRLRLEKMRDECSGKIDALEETATDEADREIRRLKLERDLLRELLEGVPEILSNFTMRCEYCLHTVDGMTHRLVRFTDTLGRKTNLIRLDGEAMAGLKDFRAFCYTKTKGVASWRGGEKHLQAANEDMIHSSAHRDIYEVDAYGFHPSTGIWFFGDCAFAPDGTMMVPDDNNVFWWESIGYQVDSSIEERGLHFDQGAPLLLTGDIARMTLPPEAKNEEPMRWMFNQFQADLLATIGDFDALYIIGMMLSYAIGPELFATHGCEPGIWLFGKRSSGKTTIARWLMRLWGFPELAGVRIDRGTTHVGMARNLNQYSFLPFWFDEYRRDVDEQKESVLRGAFDRSGSSKGFADQTNRTRNVKARTIPMVTGESSSGDAATRSRYGHTLIAASRRAKGNEKKRFEQLQRLSRYLHHIGRYLMQNRTAFAADSLLILDRWLEEPGVREQIPDERTRIVHGTGLACLCALNGMLGLFPKPDKEWQCVEGQWRMTQGSITSIFGQYLVKHSQQAFADVQEETMVHKFWQTVISAIANQEIPKTFFLIGDFTTDELGKIREYRHPELSDAAPPRKRKLLCLAAKPVYDLYAAYVRRLSGNVAPLSYSDILREISKEPFWVRGPDDATRIHRIFLNKTRYSCWVIDLDNFPYAEDFMDMLADEENYKSVSAEPTR